MMEKYSASERRVDLYDVGDGLTMMNVLVKNGEGKLKRVDTYLGIEGEGFSAVAHSDNLDQPGVIFSYSSHVRTLKSHMPLLLEMFYGNVTGKR